MRSLRTTSLVVVLLAVLAVPAFADDPSPFDPPQARLQPPVGVASEPSLWDVFVGWLMARLQPPVGSPTVTP